VDKMLLATGVIEDNQNAQERVLDSNDLERERGITILSKNISVFYGGYKINIIDTPGHADFGGEVERVLKMADGVLLLVDAFEGPMPQTRFVLKKALGHGLKPLVVINKIDRLEARPDEVLDEIYELFIELDATDEQLDFPVIYSSATKGYARNEIEDTNMDIFPLMDSICKNIPDPEVDKDGLTAMQICTLDYNDYVGRIGIGRVFSGTLQANEPVLLQKCDGSQHKGMVKNLYVFEALERKEVASAVAGDIVAVVGTDNIDIGDTFTDLENPVTLPPITLEEPTISMVFSANTSPLAGKDGKYVTGSHIRERLLKEAKGNISLRIEELPGVDGISVSGRGTLHLSILAETIRREGYEFQVARPKIIFKEIDGVKCEPVEVAVVDVPTEFAGKIIELMGRRCGELLSMSQKGEFNHLEFKIPSRGLIGIRTRIMTATKGEAIFCHNVSGYEPYKGAIPQRVNGVMVSMSKTVSVAYALDGLQARGRLFVTPGENIYEGMIIGENARESDMVVNVGKSKNLTNIRAAGTDKSIVLSPPILFSLEEALEYLNDDELLEITPNQFRFRKRLLTANERKRERRAG